MQNRQQQHIAPEQEQHSPFYPDNEIDIKTVVVTLWRGKWIILSASILFAVASVLFSLSLPNIYQSRVLLAPAEDTKGGGLSMLAGQFGGLASLAGVNVGGGGSDKVKLAIEVLRSRAFISQFIERRGILVPLMASKSWNQSEQAIVIDAEIYDTEKSAWVREVKPPRTPEPSAWEAYEEFAELLGVSREKETGFVTVSFKHVSPVFAKQWVTWLIEDVNEHIRQIDVKEAEDSINYLKQELNKTAVADMQRVFYQLIEKQMQTMMLANVRSEYVFKVVDPAVIPEEKLEPKRSRIVIVATVLGGMLGIAIVFLLNGFRNKE